MTYRMIADKYVALIDSLAKDTIGTDVTRLASTSLYSSDNFHLFSPSTLYDASLQQEFSVYWKPSLPGNVSENPALGSNYSEKEMKVWEEQNRNLLILFTQKPWLVQYTEQMLGEAGSLSTKKPERLPVVIKETEPIENEYFTDDIDEIDLVVRRPNFWTFIGDLSIQFSQNYYSENWYQGGENNYTMFTSATFEANYDNKQKITWDNKLEMRLGFQTDNSDEVHKIKTNDDLLRLTSKLGYQATKHWYYALQVQAYTQFYPVYASDSYAVSSDFMAPFYMIVSLGMDYKWDLSRFKGSANLAPIAYNLTYVARPSLYGSFGTEENKSTNHYFGPNITINYTWDICNNVKWAGRIYWFSNLEMTDIEWENTITFTINKYLSSKLFLYPRFDDSSESYRKENGSYFMFKEWLSLGLNYSF